MSFNAMLVNKSVYSMKDARVFAKAKGFKLKCKILLHNYDLYYCFGDEPRENVPYTLTYYNDNKIIFLSDI